MMGMVVLIMSAGLSSKAKRPSLRQAGHVACQSQYSSAVCSRVPCGVVLLCRVVLGCAANFAVPVAVLRAVVNSISGHEPMSPPRLHFD